MKCKEIQRWLIDLAEESLDEDRLPQVEEHMAQCAECACFEDDLEKIRVAVNKSRTPAPAEDLFRQTRLICHEVLKTSDSAESGFLNRIKATSIPAHIWLAFAILLVLTVIVILALLKELATDDPLSLQAVVTLSLMIQNAVMLFLAPLVLQKYRRRSQDLDMI